MQNYDIPEVPADMTAAEATAARNAMGIDGRNDREHPYFNSSHPAHQDWVAYAGKLAEREVACEAETRRAEQDAALDACEEVDSSDDLKDQIAALEATPGFMNGELRQSDRARHDRILAARSALYERREAEEDDGDEPVDT